eukprot:gene13568-biopygen9537
MRGEGGARRPQPAAAAPGSLSQKRRGCSRGSSGIAQVPGGQKWGDQPCPAAAAAAAAAAGAGAAAAAAAAAAVGMAAVAAAAVIGRMVAMWPLAPRPSSPSGWALWRPFFQAAWPHPGQAASWR